MSAQENYDVFLSYAREDVEIRREIHQMLLSAGLKVWVDSQGIKRGDNWRKEIEQALENSKSIVAILSPDAKKSHWVREELSYANVHGLPIFPIIVRGTKTDSVSLNIVGVDSKNIVNLEDEELASTLLQFATDIFEQLYPERIPEPYIPAPYVPKITSSVQYYNGRLTTENTMHNLLFIVKEAATFYDEHGRASIFSVDLFSEEELYMISCSRNFNNKEQNFRFKRKEGVVGQVFDKGKAYLINPQTYKFDDAVDSSQLAKQKLIATDHIQFILAVPIIHPETDQVIGVLVIDHPEALHERTLDDLDTIHNNSNILDIRHLADRMLILAQASAEILKQETYTLSFFNYRQLQQILNVTNTLFLFKQLGNYPQRQDNLIIQSAIYYRDNKTNRFYNIVSSEGFLPTELLLEFNDDQGFIGRSVKQNMLVTEDCGEMSDDEWNQYLLANLNMNKEQVSILDSIKSTLSIPIKLDQTSNTVDVVLSIMSKNLMKESQLNNPDIYTDAIRLANLIGKFIASEIKRPIENDTNESTQ